MYKSLLCPTCKRIFPSVRASLYPFKHSNYRLFSLIIQEQRWLIYRVLTSCNFRQRKLISGHIPCLPHKHSFKENWPSLRYGMVWQQHATTLRNKLLAALEGHKGREACLLRWRPIIINVLTAILNGDIYLYS